MKIKMCPAGGEGDCLNEDLIEELLEALGEIAKAEGAYSLDELTHARNTIENIVAIAEKAIELCKF